MNFHGDEIDRPRFFFIFSPNNSGSTVLSQYVASQIGGYLPPYGNNEGQTVPSVNRIMRKGQWTEAEYDWPFIRSEWERLARGKSFIEGSPPNLMRFRQIAQTFGTDSTAISSICSPYQQIASCVRRYKSPPFNPADLVPLWVMKAEKISEFRETYDFPVTNYQEFTADPESLNRSLGIPVVDAEINGKKGSGARGIQDQSATAILFLTDPEIEAVTKALRPHRGLMDYFGLEAPEIPREGHHLAAQRRADWNARGSAKPGLLRRIYWRLAVARGSGIASRARAVLDQF
ncbi:hypothetical protein AB1M95_04815 [Sulfitobacter sp. LCG007]